MEELKDVILKFGKTTINTAGLKGMTEKQFLETFSPLISTGAKEALKKVRKYLKK